MTDFSGDNTKPKVVVLGGCGFIGRNLVHYLISNDLVSLVRAVDKTPPQLAFLNANHAKTFEDPRVEYKSANLINAESCASALAGDWSLVVNCAGETRSAQGEAVLREGILTLSTNVARCCADNDLRLVELSSGCMYSGDKPQSEDGPTDPWTLEARLKAAAEAELAARAPPLRYTVLRPALVYGVADRRSLTPRILLGAIYKHLNETMKLLWTSGLRLNTVHVSDLCRAIWFVGTREDTVNKVYNVVDCADSTQGSLADIVADIFGVRVDYYGTAASTLAKTDMAAVAEEANDKHLSAWAAVCAARGTASPLEPRAAAELLLPRALRLDGSRLAALGFAVRVERPTEELVREVLEDYAAMNLFPKELLL